MVNPWQKVIGVMLLAIVLTPFTVQATYPDYFAEKDNFFTTYTFSNTWVNNSATLPLTIGVRCSTSRIVNRVSLPVTNPYGGTNGAFVYLSVNNGATTTPRVSSIDPSAVSTNALFSYLDYNVSFLCDSTATSTLAFTSTASPAIKLWTPNTNTYSNTLKPLIETKYGAIATNTRPVFVSMYASTTCTASVGTSTICDMASTTEAIYAVGHMNGLYWAILFILIFGGISFIFTKGYIK